MKLRNIACSLALGTLLTSLPMIANAHTMTTDDLTLVLRTWNNGAQATLSPGDKIEHAIAPFGNIFEVKEEKFDFLRIVSLVSPTGKITFVAHTGKDDTTPVEELSVNAVNILSSDIIMKSGICVGSPLKDLIDKFGKADRITGHTDFAWGVHDFPDKGYFYETYIYDLEGREFLVTTDNRKPNQPIVQISYRTEI